MIRKWMQMVCAIKQPNSKKKSTHPTASQSHTPTTEQQFTTSTINTLSLRCWPGLRWYPGQEFLSACSPSHHILLACQSHQNWFITFRIEIDLKRNLASVITFQVGFPVPKVLQQDQTECKFTSPPLQPQSCVVETPKVVVPSFEDSEIPINVGCLAPFTMLSFPKAESCSKFLRGQQSDHPIIIPWKTPSMNYCQLQNVELLKPKCWCYYWKRKPSWLLWLFRASPSWYNAPSMSWVSHMSQGMTCSWSLEPWNPRYSRDQNCNSWSSHLFAHQCKCHVNPGTSLDRASVELWFRLSKAISCSTTATKLNVIHNDEASTAD